MSEEMIASGTHIEYIPVQRYYLPPAFVQALKLTKFIRAQRFDIVQTFHYKADVYGALIARLAGVRHIVSSKRDAADYKQPFHFFMHRLVRPLIARYVAVSDTVADVIFTKEKVPRAKIVTIHNGVDTDHYSTPTGPQKCAAKRALNFDAEHFLVGMSAWFRPEKDHELLINAVTDLTQQLPNLRLLLIGGGPLLSKLELEVSKRGLANVIRFTGPVEDVRPFLRALDLACLIPRINEGFSNSVLEKMATGLPVVVTDVGGNREAVLDGVNGFVIPPGDCLQLQAMIKQCYNNEDLCQRFGDSSRERVLRLFSLREMLERHATLYRTMVARVERRRA